MAKMNVNRARGGDDDFGAVGAEPTMPAKYAGTCATCRQPFGVGEPIASVLVDKKMTYHHGACRYPATALLVHDTPEADVDAVATARNASTPATCRATTNKGKPCNNTPQKGEQFCGPHLTQLVARPSPDRQPITRTDPRDEPF
jgi:CCCH zinc finger in TRM13 protein